METYKHIAWSRNKGVAKQRYKKAGELLQKTREILDEFYKPYNKDLAMLLKDDKYLWIKGKTNR